MIQKDAQQEIALQLFSSSNEAFAIANYHHFRSTFTVELKWLGDMQG
jgi:hypothetical protein